MFQLSAHHTCPATEARELPLAQSTVGVPQWASKGLLHPSQKFVHRRWEYSTCGRKDGEDRRVPGGGNICFGPGREGGCRGYLGGEIPA